VNAAMTNDKTRINGFIIVYIPVIPAEAGIQHQFNWTPAFAGVTIMMENVIIIGRLIDDD